MLQNLRISAILFSPKLPSISWLTANQVLLPGGEWGVVDEAEELLRVTDRDEAFHGQVKSQGLVLRRLVHWGGVTFQRSGLKKGQTLTSRNCLALLTIFYFQDIPHTATVWIIAEVADRRCLGGVTSNRGVKDFLDNAVCLKFKCWCVCVCVCVYLCMGVIHTWLHWYSHLITLWYRYHSHNT